MKRNSREDFKMNSVFKQDYIILDPLIDSENFLRKYLYRKTRKDLVDI